MRSKVRTPVPEGLRDSRGRAGMRVRVAQAGRSVLAGLVLAQAWGCATYSDRTAEARAALKRGDYDASITAYNKILAVNDAEKLPSEWKKNTPLVVLERATVLQAKASHELSARDYQAADKELEMLDLAGDAGGQIGKYIYSDSATKYKTSPTEKLSLNAMNMCNYLATRDLSGAQVEARRFTVMRNYFRDHDPAHAHGAFGSYLAGFAFERSADFDRALRYYDEALQQGALESLRETIPRLAQRATYRGERLGGYLESTAPPGPPPNDPEAAAMGDILVIAKVGRAPYKIPRRIPIGLAVGMAGTFITGNPKVLEHSMFKVVTYPELTRSDNVYTDASVLVGGHAVPTDLVTDLGMEVAREYEEALPKIIGSAITRMITRALAAEGARVAGQQAKEGGQLIGFLAAAVVEGTMVALDKPDTRSWETLPNRVFIGRVRVPAGTHHLEVVLQGPQRREARTYDVTIEPGGFAVVDVTTLR